MPRYLLPLGFLFAPLALALHGPEAQPAAGKALAAARPLAVLVDATGKHAYVALHGRAAVAVVDLQAGKVLREIAVDAGPYDLAATDDTLYVTCSRADTVVVIDRKTHAVRRKIAVGQEPRGIFVEPKPLRVTVACHDEQALCWFEKDDGPLRKRPLDGFPDLVKGRSDPNAGIVYALLRQGTTYRLEHELRFQGDTLRQPSKAMKNTTNARGLTADPAAVMAYQRPRQHLPATQIAQGWVFVNNISFGGDWNVALDTPQRGFADPCDIVGSLDNQRLYVASGGTDAVAVVHYENFKNYVFKPRAGFDLDDPTTRDYFTDQQRPDDLTGHRHFVLATIPVQANPRRLGLSDDGKTLVVSNYLADSLTVIDTVSLKVVRHIPLGGPPADAAKRGEILFNSAKLTFQTQFTCASCHPGGGSDGLNWDLPRDGVGNFFNTRSLLGVKDTAPYGWHSTSPTLADRVAGTLRTLHQYEPTDQEVADIVAYLLTLEPPRPLPIPAGKKEAVVRGKVIFEGKALCNKCHRRSALDDDLPHDIGTRGPGDVKAAFDVPALRGVARTAPYLHDGRAETLEAIFEDHNGQQRHGAAHQLTPAEFGDLMDYLRSL